MINFIPCELLVGVVNLLKQGLEPESDVGAREPDGAAGNVNRFKSWEVLSKHLKGHLAPRVSHVTFLGQRVIPGSL